MARRYETITELYHKTIAGLAAPRAWQSFLTTACHNFRLPFDEQVLLYAQRPDATAVLTIDGRNGWNQRFGRWVNRGATGIAVFDSESIGRSRLKYYFDISDTHESRFSRPVPIWTMRPEYESAVVEALENSFGELADKNSFAAALLSASQNAVQDNMPDYLAELKYYKENSFLEELDDLNIEVEYRRALENSISFMLLTRCGIDPAEYFTEDDFRDIADFSTPETLNALGTATGDIGQMCLSVISRTVLPLQRQAQRETGTFAPVPNIQYSETENRTTTLERSENHERTDLHDAERIPTTGSASTPGAGNAPWEIRIAEEDIPEAAPQSDLHESADIGQTEPTSDGDRANRSLPDGIADRPDGESRGRDGGAESQRPDDDYTKKYGLLSSRGNSLAFGEDSSYCLLCSLEVLDEEGNLKRKADMFTKRTIRPHEAVTSVDTASEALAVSISEKARVDMEYMAELSGKSEDELETDLSGVIFRDIQCAEEAAAIPKAFVDLNRFSFVPADEYLSGNVRRKLRMAKALYEVLPAEKKPLIARNIAALEAVQPVDLTAAEIGVRIGANWIPMEIYQKFMTETFGTGYYAGSRIKILRSSATGQWAITDKNTDRGNIKTTTTYGTKRMNAYQILEQTLNQRDVRVFDYVEDENGNKKPVLNKKETAIAQDRQELIKQKFSEWIWKDIDRREQLCHIYNETFNSIRPREYDGSHIRFSGMNPEITLRPHQVNAIAHIMYGGNTLLAHEVGAGKTFEMVAAAMEMKRLGLCTKSLIVVPNHITEQWAAEWLQLYPSANILVATKKDFETRNRKKFCARIATGDYDAVIIGHSQFEKIPISVERQAAILQQQIDEIMFGIEEAKSARAERYTVKQLERTRKSLETRLERLNDQSRKDDLVTFEELGVDRIFVDESHYFKNLFLATKMRNVGGIAQTEAQKSSDLFMKCRYLDEITGGRGVIFATGTPISNSMVELYTIQRYLQYNTLQEMGLIHFDDWASDFGETITAIELSPEGSGYRAKTRFAKFFNLPELMATFKQVADIQTADMLKLPVPKENFHTEVIQPSELQQEMVRGLAERAEDIRAGGVDPKTDNMLRITNDGRKLALDMRLINPLAMDDPNGKVATCARNVIQIWEQNRERRSAQLVFCDLSTPKEDGTFSVYNDLKKKLMEAGIPEEEIAFIHDANTEARKKELFSKVRSGQVRILMGSTQKMGAGTNVQDRLIALHDLDCPWRPSDLAQRLGRIVRQGNQNPEVEIFRYVTEGTFDAYLYQLVENKQKFIAQIMTSKAPVRVADDVDETALSYSEIKALATGNPLIIEKCNLDMEVGKLNMLKASYLSQKYALEDMVLKKYPEAITRLTERIAGYEQDVQLSAAHPKPQEGFAGITILEQSYTEKEAAGKAILDVCTKMTGSDAVFLGQYRGFSLTLSYDGASNEYRMTMKGTLSHTAVLGADVFGNLTRMDNVIDGLPGKLEAVRAELADTRVQLENARTELAAPFAREAELAEKTARLKELNILLNMDQKDNALIDDAPDEDVPERPRLKGMER